MLFVDLAWESKKGWIGTSSWAEDWRILVSSKIENRADGQGIFLSSKDSEVTISESGFRLFPLFIADGGEFYKDSDTSYAKTLIGLYCSKSLCSSWCDDKSTFCIQNET